VSEEQLFYCRDLCRKKEGLENSVKKWLKIYLLIYYVQSFVDYVKNSRLGAFVISSFFFVTCGFGYTQTKDRNCFR